MRILEIKEGKVICPMSYSLVPVDLACWNCIRCESMDEKFVTCDLRY